MGISHVAPRGGGGISQMSAGLSHPCPAGARAGTEGGAGIGSRKGRGPTQWGGPAESSVHVRGALKFNGGSCWRAWKGPFHARHDIFSSRRAQKTF